MITVIIHVTQENGLAQGLDDVSQLIKFVMEFQTAQMERMKTTPRLEDTVVSAGTVSGMFLEQILECQCCQLTPAAPGTNSYYFSWWFLPIQSQDCLDNGGKSKPQHSSIFKFLQVSCLAESRME